MKRRMIPNFVCGFSTIFSDNWREVGSQLVVIVETILALDLTSCDPNAIKFPNAKFYEII